MKDLIVYYRTWIEIKYNIDENEFLPFLKRNNFDYVNKENLYIFINSFDKFRIWSKFVYEKRLEYDKIYIYNEGKILDQEVL